MTFKRQLGTALLMLVLGCLVGAGWLAWHNLQTATQSELSQAQTDAVIDQFDALLSSLKDAETGQRGYIITGNPAYLEPYQASLGVFPHRLADLRRLTADNPAQQQRLDALMPLIAAKLANLKETIGVREAHGFAAARAAVMVQSGKQLMDDIRELVAQAVAEERQLLKTRTDQAVANSRRTIQSVLLCAALGALALLMMWLNLRAGLASRQRAHTSLRGSEQRLRVATDAAELGIWIWLPDDDRITWQNVRPYAILGMSQADAPLTVARFAAEFVYSEDLAAFERAIADTVQNGVRLFFQGRIHCTDRALRWIEFTGQPEPGTGTDGPLLRVIGTVQDITERKHAEELAARQTAELATLYATAPVGLFFFDADLRYVRVNPAMADLNGLPAEQHIGRTLHELLTPELAEDVESQVRQVLETGLPLLNCEVHGATAPRPGEQQRYWLVSYHPVQAVDGTIRGVQGAVQEITERKQAEQALRESQARYRSLFDSIDEGFCVVDMLFDAHEKPIDYRFLEVNPAFEQQTGLHDTTGRRMREIVPDHEAHWFEVFGKVALTGQAIRFTNEVKALDGRWFDVYACQLGGPHSRKVAILFNNITARKQSQQALERLNATLERRVQERTAELSKVNDDLQAEITAKERLRESEERLLTVAENLTEGLCITTMEGEFIHWNRASLEMHGFASMAECMGHLADLTTLVEVNALDGAPLPFDQWPMSRALRGEQVLNSELRIRRTDTGMERILNYGGTSVRDSAGKQSAFLTVTDITERKRAEAQLRELNDTLERRVLKRTLALADQDRRKDEFLAMLGHELRNPLAALSNAVELLRLQKNEEPLQQQGRAIIERQVGQLKHLVDDLLEVSRIATGSVRLRQESVALSGVVDRALETVGPLIAEHRHALTLALPPEPIMLHADAARLEQVLVNLLSNAAKYTEDGGRIWLSITQEGESESESNEAVLRIRDNGIGIAPDLLPHIFDLFTQAERSLDRSQGGLGIGLSLVQRLVELHGGSVTAQSILGQGSEFVVRLPLMPLMPLMQTALAPLPTDLPARLPAHLPAHLPVKAAAPPARGCQVLIVDDNEDAARTLAKILEMTGHQVRLAYDGPSALQAVLDYRPEVVLLDIGLPELDGFEVARQIRQQAELSGMVLVALTGYGREADRQLSQDAGFDYHLVKPASLNDIEKILSSVSMQIA
jgi:PAS domain S-box-containing protein